MVCGLRLPVFLPDGLDFPGGDRFVEELLHKADVLLYVGVVNFQKLRIFLDKCHRAGRGDCHYLAALGEGLAESLKVDFGVAGGGGNHTVGNLRHAAAALVHQVDAVAEGVHHRHEVFSESGVVVVGVAAVEIADVLLEVILPCGGVFLEPVHEGLG